METQRLLQLNTEASQGFWVMQAILPHWNCSRRLHVAHSPWPHLDMQHTLHTVCLWPKQCMEEGWKINTPAHKCLKINLQSQNVTVLFFLGGGGFILFCLFQPTALNLADGLEKPLKPSKLNRSTHQCHSTPRPWWATDTSLALHHSLLIHSCCHHIWECFCQTQRHRQCEEGDVMRPQSDILSLTSS